MAILDPKTFEEAVASATRLETLDRSKTGSKITGAVVEVVVEEEEKEVDPMSELLDRFGLVLARLETLPPPAPPGQPAPKNKNVQRTEEQPTQFYQNRNYQNRPKESYRAPAAGGRGRGPGPEQRMFGNAPGNGGGYFKRDGFKKYDRSEYCLAHQMYGHATDSCSWLKGKLKEIGPPERFQRKPFKPSSERREQGN